MWFLKKEEDTVETWAYLNQVFTKEECEQIIKLGNSIEPQTAKVGGSEGVISDSRDSHVSWILPSQESENLFRKMTDIVTYLNDKYFNFELTGFGEGFQFTKYEAPAGRYNVHIDKIHGGLIRKLSVVVQLSDPEDYEGGQLMIQDSENPIPIERKQGFLAAFPSYVLHGVTPVTKGTRYSLVAWITGPNFR